MNPVQFMALFEEFRADSWNGWRDVLARITPAVREFYAIAGRGSGKSRIVALLAAAFATREHKLAPGEHVYVAVFAPDRKQAGVTFRYVVGMLRSVPELAALIVRESRESVELVNGVIVEVLTASKAAPRGRSYVLAIVEEAAFLQSDEYAADTDTELIRALRPALARVPGSLLAVVSSPYARRGILWAAWKRQQAQPSEDVVLIQEPTLKLNPLFDAKAVERAFEDDPVSAQAEYGAEFRSDVETFISPEAVEAVVVPGRHELAPTAGYEYRAFLDFAGGAAGGDSAVLAVAHAERRNGRTIAVLDLIREKVPPFSPEQVCAEFADAMRPYGAIRDAIADRWGGQFPVEHMRKHGITVKPSDRSKSDIYRDVLPLINSGGCELLDVPRLVRQVCGLERRTARGGRDSIDHPPGQRDDVINAVAGAITLAGLAPSRKLWAAILPDRSGYRGEASQAMQEIRARKSANLARELEEARMRREQVNV